MDTRAVAPFLVGLMAVLSGCVSEDLAAPAPEPAGVEGDEGSGAEREAPRVEAGVAEPEPVITAFEVAGETPASLGVCGLPEPSDPCASHVIDGGDYVLDIPHAGNVTAVVFTLTFDPVVPTVTELYHMLHIDDGTTNTMVSGGMLASGDEVTLDGLEVNATATITFFAWPGGYETPLGPAWVDPVVQPFEVDGVITELTQ